MRAIILSAGLGERLRPLTLQKAKPAVEFLNVPMMAFPYYWLSTLKLSDVVINTHYLPETVKTAAKHVVDPSVYLHFSHEPDILGSGGGIWNARFDLKRDKNFAVANGDGVVLFEDNDTLEKMHEFHDKKNALATFLVCPHEGVGTRLPGVWMDAYDEVANFGLKPDRENLRCLHYASYFILSERVWNELPEGSSNILYDVLYPMIKNGDKVYGYPVESMRWFETGNVADYLNATRECFEILRRGGRMAELLVDLLDKKAPMFRERSSVKEARLIADDAEIGSGCSFGGFTVIGSNAQIGEGAELENCVVLSGANVAPRSRHQNQVLI